MQFGAHSETNLRSRLGAIGKTSSDPAVKAFVMKVFAWMSTGLLLTAVMAVVVAGSPRLTRMVGESAWVLMIVEIGLVLLISLGINHLSSTVATGLFLLYSAVNGLTLSVIFLVYTTASISSTFFITAGVFGSMAAYGYFTKRDLTSWGSLALMGLIGIILASIVNWFLQSETLYWAITYIGVIIFVALTAYDTQKVKMMAEAGGDEETRSKEAVLGALSLYLDFILLFLYLLRIFGRRR
jgi:uncharacterized protein